MNLPLISVIIPTKNRSKELIRAIDSVLKQTYQNFEILVIDDHSEEDIKFVVESYKNDNIKYFKSDKHPSNANVCRNIGLNNANGDYIAMLDSDDEWKVNHLESKLNFLLSNNSDGVFGSYSIFDGETFREVISRDIQVNENMANYLLTNGKAATPTHFYKTDCAKSVMWNEELLRHQDYDFSIRFADKYKFVPSSEITSIVHWVKGEQRTQHFPSQKLFIKLHKSSISNAVYNRYHQTVYEGLIKQPSIAKDVMQHYNKERFRYLRAMSFVDYMTFQVDSPGVLKKIILRISYVVKVLVGR